MNKQRYVVALGAALLAVLLTACSKSSDKLSIPSKAKEIVSAVTAIPKSFAGGFNPKAKVVESTKINNIELNSKAHPELTKFLQAYAEYGFEKGVLGEPKGAVPIAFEDGQILIFKSKVKDNTFHAITLKKGAPKAYAVWGVIGDSWHATSAKAWGYPTSYEEQGKDAAGKIIITQNFEKGTVTWSHEDGIKFQSK